MGAAGFGDRRARASHTDAAVTDSLESPLTFISPVPGRETPEPLGRMRARGDRAALRVCRQEAEAGSALHIHVATAAMNFYILAAARVKVVALSIETSRRSTLGECY